MSTNLSTIFAGEPIYFTLSLPAYHVPCSAGWPALVGRALRTAHQQQRKTEHDEWPKCAAEQNGAIDKPDKTSQGERCGWHGRPLPAIAFVDPNAQGATQPLGECRTDTAHKKHHPDDVEHETNTAQHGDGEIGRWQGWERGMMQAGLQQSDLVQHAVP